LKGRLEWLIALRYLHGNSQTQLFSLSNRLCIFFLSVIVALMVTAIAIFTGFQLRLNELLLSAGTHISMEKKNGTAIRSFEIALAEIRDDPELSRLVSAAYGAISLNALLELPDRFESKTVMGVPVEAEELSTGRLKHVPHLIHYDARYLERFNTENTVIVGRLLARDNKWEIGDRIAIIIPGSDMTGPDGPDIDRTVFRIAGFFRSGFNDFDQNLLFFSLPTGQRLLKNRSAVTDLIVQVRNLNDLQRVKSRVQEYLPENPYAFNIYTIMDLYGNFIAAMQLEKTLITIVLGLLLLAGVVGIWVTVTILVRQKRKSIGILRAMGIPVDSIILIFTVHAMLTGLIAAALGTMLGVFFSTSLDQVIKILEALANGVCSYAGCGPVQIMPDNIYYFDHLPVRIETDFLLMISLVLLFLSGLAGYFPSRRAALESPIETIRNL